MLILRLNGYNFGFILRRHYEGFTNQRYELSQTQKFARELEKIQINLIVKIGANGALFGSITKDEISNALKTQKGLELDKKCLEFEHIKTPGIYEITAKLKHGINAKFKLEIKGE